MTLKNNDYFSNNWETFFFTSHHVCESEREMWVEFTKRELVVEYGGVKWGSGEMH